MSDPQTSTAPVFEFDNTYARQLEGFAAPWQAVAVPDPQLVKFNHGLASSLGLDPDVLDGPLGAEIFSGNTTPDGAQPIAQAYAGHQFGGFNPQLGDGRALLLGELIDPLGARHDIVLKGSGRTPFSRGGDGRAALGPVLREYLMGEAMHALGIPTTRALAAVTTGEPVHRERPLPGAILTRAAASHLRVGTFQFFAARGDVDRLRRLVGYSIARHDPHLVEAENAALALLEVVIARQASLIAAWMHVGFIHGVMNTDNVAVSGETIDFGPCAFLEGFDPGAVFSSIDHGGRYAYGNQPSIGKWNVARLAEALLPLIHDDDGRAIELATEALGRYDEQFQRHWLDGIRPKLGLHDAHDGDAALAQGWLELLAAERVDHTQAWRRLAAAAEGDRIPLHELVVDRAAVDRWLDRWVARQHSDGIEPFERGSRMRRINPIHIPRNHLVEEALEAAVEHGDHEPFEGLLDAVSDPFDAGVHDARFARPAPPDFTATYRTHCGT